jgi:hypothetical protein
MTVLDKMVTMVCTGFTDLPLIVGNDLKDIMNLAITAIEVDYLLIDEAPIKYDEHENYYLPEFYHHTWELFLLPIVIEFVTAHCPKAWFLKLYYELKYKAS